MFCLVDHQFVPFASIAPSQNASHLDKSSLSNCIQPNQLVNQGDRSTFPCLVSREQSPESTKCLPFVSSFSPCFCVSLVVCKIWEPFRFNLLSIHLTWNIFSPTIPGVLWKLGERTFQPCSTEMCSSALVSPEYAHTHQLSNCPDPIILSNLEILIHSHLHETVIYQSAGLDAWATNSFSSIYGWGLY